jgi:hypothetical protein
MGVVLVLVGFVVIVHAVFPNMCKDTGVQAVKAMARVFDEGGV